MHSLEGLGKESENKSPLLQSWDDLSRSSLGSLSLLAQPTRPTPTVGGYGATEPASGGNHRHQNQWATKDSSENLPLSSSPSLVPAKDFMLYQQPEALADVRGSSSSHSPRHQRQASSGALGWEFFPPAQRQSFGQSSLSTHEGQSSSSVTGSPPKHHWSLLLPRPSRPVTLFGEVPTTLPQVFAYLDRASLVAWGTTSVWCARSVALMYPRATGAGASSSSPRQLSHPQPQHYNGAFGALSRQYQWPSYPTLGPGSDSGKFSYSLNIEVPIPRSSSHSSFLQANQDSRIKTLTLYIMVTEVALILGATLLGAFGAGMLEDSQTIAMCLFGIAIGMGIVAVGLLIWWCLQRDYNRRQCIYTSW